MTCRTLLSMTALLGLVLVGCAAQGINVARTADNDGVVRGSVAYRERVALPPDAVVEVWITDVSPLILAAVVIAETTVKSEGRQVPIPFELRYDPSRIEPSHTYGIRVAIRSGGRMLFATDTAHPVITQGNPTQVNLWLKSVTDESGIETRGLVGTAWRLEDLGGAGVLDRAEASLEFPEAGKVAGRGSCNRFFGTVEFSGASMKFGPLGSTRVSCVEAVMNQEAKYLTALQGAERFTLAGSTLLIYYQGTDKPLRFLPKEP